MGGLSDARRKAHDHTDPTLAGLCGHHLSFAAAPEALGVESGPSICSSRIQPWSEARTWCSTAR